MPYITKERREAISKGDSFDTPGELNYVLTELCLDYIERVSDTHIGYSILNEVIGVLESAKLEFYRRLVSPYEDGALSRNGEVYHSTERGK